MVGCWTCSGLAGLMPGLSPKQKSHRQLVAKLKTLGKKYAVALSFRGIADATDALVKKAYRDIAKKTHPDKGGDPADFRSLRQAYDDWLRGTPSKEQAAGEERDTAEEGVGPQAASVGLASIPKVYEWRTFAVMLTYQNVKDLAQWCRFDMWLKSCSIRLGIKHWCGTLERCPLTDNLHIHAMFQFRESIRRQAEDWLFEGLRPNVSVNDLLGECMGGRNFQASVDRGMFYVWVAKIGQVSSNGVPCVAGNRGPAWTDMDTKYAPKVQWAEKWWQLRKLTHEYYKELIVLCRQNVAVKLRQQEAVVQAENEKADRKRMGEDNGRIAKNPRLTKPYKTFEGPTRWLQMFASDARRYPIMIVLGESHIGKTDWLVSLFRNPLQLRIGILTSEVWPARLRDFVHGEHDGIVLDDIRDLQWVVDNQERLQGQQVILQIVFNKHN